MNTRLIICNRAAAASVGGWIHIVPRGELPNTAAGLVQVLDDASLDSILANLQQDQQRLGTNWPGLYAGREHFIYDAAQDSEALAWFKNFEKRPDGIWARDDGLTSVGADAVKNRLYKFTSFVADPADLEPVGDEVTRRGQAATTSGAPVSDPARFKNCTTDTPGLETGAPELPRYRVMKIETVGFTNHANGKELLTPIVNRDESVSDDVKNRLPHSLRRALQNISAGASAPAQPNPIHLPNQGPNMKSVCTLLGLPAEAEETAMHAAVSKLLNRGDISADALAALKAEHQSLGAQNQILLAEQSDALLDTCAVRDERIRNRFTDALKLLQNRAERLRYLADFGYAPGGPRETVTTTATSPAPAAIIDRRFNGRVLNRGTGTMRETISVASAAGEGEQVVAIKIQNRASELQGKGLKYDSAWNQARREVLGRM